MSSITFYVIGCILTVRKIILWFFLASSPLYPIVLLYNPIKNTAKIWISEFLRWLLYAPLFALFLSAVVIIYKSDILILPFKFGTATTPLYPTAISILVGGPGQQLSLTNSLNYTDTYVQYVIALLMLWVAILMPFILLQILLDFLSKYEFGKSPMVGYINALQNSVSNNGFTFLKKPPQPSPLPTGQFPAGLAREIPRHAVTQQETTIKRTVATISEQQPARQQAGQTSYTQLGNVAQERQAARQQTSAQVGNVFRQQQTTNQTQRTNVTNVTENKQQTTQTTQRPVTTAQFKPEILARPTSRLISFPIPTMRDIATFETARLSRAEVSTHQLQQTKETLGKIANPKTNATSQEVQHYTTLREQLNQETTRGDVLAKSILSAASTVQQTQETQRFTTLYEQLTQEATKGNILAKSVLSTASTVQQTQETLGKIANPKTSATPSEAQHFTALHEQLTQEATKGDVLAKSILSAASTVQKPQEAKAELPVASLPVMNQIQTVSFDDYEAVKSLWLENYQQIDVPLKYSNRRSWIKDDGETVSLAITLLSSPDPTKVREGLTSVSSILPFLLIGGFSQTEVIAYLKAKQAAGKGALEELAKKEENEETLLLKGAKKVVPKELHIEAKLDEKDKNK